MKLAKIIWRSPAQYLTKNQPDYPIIFFSPQVLQANTNAFLNGFPGMVTYAIKANPAACVLSNLLSAGIQTFDVASPTEMDQVRAVSPDAVLHYNNPVRSRNEITYALKMNVASYSIDSDSELTKLAEQVPTTRTGTGTEIAVRFKLPLNGAAYDFGAKFGLVPEQAIQLLKRVKQLGYAPSLSFHPGTQCTSPGVWHTYIETAAHISKQADIPIARLNVGGGFPSHRLNDVTPQHNNIFAEIAQATKSAFGQNAPMLICEPGRAIVGDAFCLATRIKAIRDNRDVFLNEGVYGGLAEYLVVGGVDRLEIISPKGTPRQAPSKSRQIFGPTCDSVDRLYENHPLPGDIQEGDYVIFHGLGAYSTTLATQFNGYGVQGIENVEHLTGG